MIKFLAQSLLSTRATERIYSVIGEQRRVRAFLERFPVMLKHLPAPVVAGLVPATPDYLAPSLMVGIAGTSPAMTRFYG
jgi:hypothetical protein